MELITVRGLIRTVADRWREQYSRSTYEAQRMKQAALCALDSETATAADVEAIIGNSSWTDIRCHECGRYVCRAVQLGEPPDYESSTATICADCLVAAVQLVCRPGS